MELLLFQSVGQGLPLWLPKGTMLRDQLEDFLKEYKKNTDTHKSVLLTSDQRPLGNIWSLRKIWQRFFSTNTYTARR